jgi:hypothetical protein
MSTPTNGVDRCPCGCKYWNAPIPAIGGVYRCFDCNDPFDSAELRHHRWGHVCDVAEPNCGYNPCIVHQEAMT